MEKHHKRFERYLLFSAVAQHLSFTHAATTLDISRSYLSEQIARLEKSLGVSLLIRSTRSVRLTPAGEEVLASMQHIQSEITQLERRLQNNDDQIAGQLRITAPEMFAQRYLFKLCQAFRDRHPEVTFDIDLGHQPEDLTQSRFDLAIRATSQPPENMVAQKLCEYQHICCAAPSYLEQNGHPSTPDDLADHDCLAAPYLSQWLFRHQGQKYLVNVSGSLVANNHFALLQAAQNGMGIVRLPDYLAEPGIKEGRLRPVLSEYFLSKNDIQLIYPQQIKQSARLTLFVQFLKQAFEHK